VYTVTVTPLAGFTGPVNLSTSALPTGVVAAFNPTSVNLVDANSRTSTLSLATGLSTPVNNHAVTINGQSGSVLHSVQAALNVVSATSADLSLTKTASPNPGQAGVSLSYRITVTNNGPAAATNVSVADTLPAGVAFGSAITTQGNCNVGGPINCNLGSLAVGGSAIVTIVVTPSTPGQIVNSATVSANESDFDSTNNTASTTTVIQPAAASPIMLDDNLTVSTVVAGLDQPTSMAFLGPNDFLVLERATGKVKRIVNGVLQSTPLDLAVN